MDPNSRNTIYYPMIPHPLISMRLSLRDKILTLFGYLPRHSFYSRLDPGNLYPWKAPGADALECYLTALEQCRLQFCSEDSAVKDRMDQFSLDLRECGASPAEKSIFHHLARLCRLFALRFVFLFDVLFLLAPDDPQRAGVIRTAMLDSANPRDRERIDLLFRGLDDPNTAGLTDLGIAPEQLDAWHGVQRYLASSPQRVVFTATLSAGKSTLLNEIIGQELADTKNEACTAVTMDFCTAPCRRNRYDIQSSEGTLTRLLPWEVRQYTKGRTSPCRVTGYVQSPFTDRRVVLCDTPGVNSVRFVEHRKIARSALSFGKNDVIVYVIPAENYGSADDYEHLRFIQKHVTCGRILFVVNRMDTCDFEDDSVEEILGNVKAHLESQIGFDHPVVCPVSAKAGLLMKLALTGNPLSSNEEKSLMALYEKLSDPEYDMGRWYGSIPVPELPCDRYKFTQVAREDLYKAYLHTGCPQFETILSGVLCQ